MKSISESFYELGYFLLVVFFAICFLLWGFKVYSGIEQSFADDYCSSVLYKSVKPPFVNSVWAEFKGLDQGYVSCCNLYYENNTINTKCRIFQYIKGV